MFFCYDVHSMCYIVLYLLKDNIFLVVTIPGKGNPSRNSVFSGNVVYTKT